MHCKSKTVVQRLRCYFVNIYAQYTNTYRHIYNISYYIYIYKYTCICPYVYT